MLASVTLLPAVIGFTGKNIDKFKLPWFHREEKAHHVSMWFRWSRLIQRKPGFLGALALVALLALSVPVFSMELGFADAASGSTDRSSRRAYDLLSEGFGPGFNGPLLLTAEIDSPEDLETLGALSEQLAGVDGVVATSPPIPNEAGDTAIINVFPATSPQHEDTGTLVKELRENVLDEATGDNPEVLVGGLTASVIDFANVNGERLPILIGGVLLLSFLLLVVVFRSILVPLKAVVMNLLSIGAAYGVVVAIFQWGWGASLIGVETTAPIEAWVPMMLFTILFGLSMDYEIFLLSRIREEYVRTRGQRAGRRERPGGYGPGDLRSRGDHGHGVPVLRLRIRRESDQAVRYGPGGCDPRRRDDRQDDPRAGDDGTARRCELVAAEDGSRGSCRGSASSRTRRSARRPIFRRSSWRKRRKRGSRPQATARRAWASTLPFAVRGMAAARTMSLGTL